MLLRDLLPELFFSFNQRLTYRRVVAGAFVASFLVSTVHLLPWSAGACQSKSEQGRVRERGMRVPGQRQQCLLGGDPELFQISQLDSLVFRFVVSCSNVGFLVIRLSPIVLDSLKLGFFLCNDRGFQEAISFSKLDYGPSCDWIEVRSRSSKRSYADAVKSKVTPLSGLGSQFNPAGRFFLGY